MRKFDYEIDENDCWVRDKRLNSSGYPIFSIKRKQHRIHRYHYQQYKGEIPEGYIVRHTCDNRKCINPDHLILGTHVDNVKDRVERNRSAKHEKNGRSKLTLDIAREIRQDTQTKNEHLAKKYGVDSKVIRNIKQNKSWKE